MNQILEHKLDNDYISSSLNSRTPIINKNEKIYFKIFVIAIIILSVLVIYILFYFYNLRIKKDYNKQLSQSFIVSTLYSSNNTYSIPNINSSSKNIPPFIIGSIKIQKIDLSYPILSYADDSTLSQSVARFAGPMPNEIGNLCIAGHNNIDNSFFGKLGLLKIGDEIQIYDSSNNFLIYNIYDKYETSRNDLSCISQETNGSRIVTLITCNSLKDTRKIYKAKAE